MFTLKEIIQATGGSCVRDGRCAGGVSIDSRTLRPGQVFVAIKGDTFDGHAFIPEVIAKGAACVVFERGKYHPGEKSRGRAALVSVEDSVRALADIARFHRRRFDIPLVAVTGSNGKTTTKDMCAWVLGSRFGLVTTEGTKNNHIGVPLTLLRLDGNCQAAVLELGTNHFGEIRGLARTAEPTIGVITSIGPSHLEYFGTLAGVAREKLSLIEELSFPAIAVVNGDDPCLGRTAIAKKRKPFIISIGVHGGRDFRARDVECGEGRVRFSLGGARFELATPGAHNVYNALAACAVARVMGLGYGTIASRLRSFKFPAGRLAVTRINGAVFINDSYNSSPASLEQAMHALAGFKKSRRRIMVMGDMLELGKRQEYFHREAGRKAARVCGTLVAVGTLSRLAMKAFLASGGREAYACGDAEEAKEIVFAKLCPARGDAVLVKGSRRMKLDRIFTKA